MYWIVALAVCFIAPSLIAMDTADCFVEWNGVAYQRGSWPQYNASVKMIADLGVNFDNKSVLDVGSGTGQLLVTAQKAGARRVTAVDPSGSMLEIAAKKFAAQGPSAEWMTIQSYAENFNINYCCYNFDIAMSWFCLHLVSDKRKVLENIFYSLKPGGELICNITTKENGDPLGVVVLNEYNALLYKNFQMYANMAIGRSKITQENLQQALEDIGFVDIKIEPMDISSYFKLTSRDETKRFMLPLILATPLYQTIAETNRERFFENFIDYLEERLNQTGRLYTTKTTLVYARKPV